MVEISVIIVNYRGWEHLQRCLESLRAVDLEQNRIEIIVVDNCSCDGKLEVFKQQFPFVQFILNSGNNGFSNGCNLGASYSSGEYFLFLNSDIIANEEAITGMLGILKSHPGMMLLSCRQKNNAGKLENPYKLFPRLSTLSGVTRAVYKLFCKSKKFDVNSDLIYPDWVSGSVIMIAAKHYKEVGGWCEDYWLYFEDVDICFNVWELGGKVALSNQYTMIHNHGGATRVNQRTAALTKAEVIISKHVFVARHFGGMKAFFMHWLILLGVLSGKLLPTILSIPFFLNRKLKIYRLLYGHLLLYYFNAVKNSSWKSPRSMNFGK